MKELFAILCMIGLSSRTFSFDWKTPVKFGKVTAAEFGIDDFQGNDSVPAIVLCDFGEIEITNRTYYKRHIRIKINTGDGLKYARFELPYRFRERHDDILVFKASAFSAENKEIVRYHYGITNASTVEIDHNHRKKVLELPDVKPGMIVEFYYEMASLDFVRLDDWFFQREIPTLWSEIRFEVPPPFHYLVTFRHGEYLSHDEQVNYAEKLRWLYEANRLEKRAALARGGNLLYSSASGKYKVYVINNMQKKIVMKNLSGVTAVSEFISIRDYYPKLRFDLFESSGHLPWYFRPLLLTTLDDYDSKSRREHMYGSRISGYVHYRLDTWTDFNEKLLKGDRFGMQLTRHIDFKTPPDSIISAENDARAKMESVYDYVRQHYSWNGRFTMYAENSLQNLIDKGEGPSGSINLLLIRLLRRSGLRTDPVLIRTNDLGLPETVFPVHNQFNHVVAMVIVNEDTYLLDAVSDEGSPAVLPAFDLHTTGWRVNNKDFGWVDIGTPRGTGQSP